MILSELEAQGGPVGRAGPEAAAAPPQFSLEDMSARAVTDRLRAADIDTLTPIEAMSLLYELKQKLT